MNDSVPERLMRIEEKIDTLIEIRKDHEGRLRAVEKKQWYHTGGLAAVAFLFKFVTGGHA